MSIERRSLVFARRRFDFLENLDHAGAALDGIVEVKNQLRRVFQDDVTRELRLQGDAMRFQLRDYIRSARTENADIDVCFLQVGRDVDLIDRDERFLERDFASDDDAELTFEEFVDAFLSMFHRNVEELIG
jgi:hypothetical protein